MEFKPEYVRCTWSPELEGKKVLFSDSIELLMDKVCNSKEERECCERGSSLDLPFKCGAPEWRFVYYDPNYTAKIAQEQGKKIECKRKGDAWEDWDYTPDPQWLDDHEYRIKPEEEKPVTKRELARWLAQGNGEYSWYDGEDGFTSKCGIELRYYEENANEKVVQVKIRKWEDQEWHTPTREYMGLEE